MAAQTSSAPRVSRCALVRAIRCRWPRCAAALRGRGRLARDPARPAELRSPAVLALGILFVGVIGAVLVQVRFGLEPLRRLGRALGAIRAGATARLRGDFPAEIEPLATELNALLEHNEALVERARTHVGNLACWPEDTAQRADEQARRSQGLPSWSAARSP